MAKVDFVAPLSGSLNWDTNKRSDEFGLECLDKSLAVQSQKDDADINVIMKRFGVTGQMPNGVMVPPTFQDFTDAPDFRQAMDLMKSATDSFMQMNADTRARFLNDPARFVDFCSKVDEKGNLVNYDEMLKMGLAVEKVVPAKPAPTEVVIVGEPAKPV